MKYPLILLVALLASSIWRSNRRSIKKDDAPPDASEADQSSAQDMVQCAYCAVHVPRPDAVQGKSGIYCGTEHRDRLEN